MSHSTSREIIAATHPLSFCYAEEVHWTDRDALFFLSGFSDVVETIQRKKIPRKNQGFLLNRASRERKIMCEQSELLTVTESQ